MIYDSIPGTIRIAVLCADPWRIYKVPIGFISRA